MYNTSVIIKSACCSVQPARTVAGALAGALAGLGLESGDLLDGEELVHVLLCVEGDALVLVQVLTNSWSSLPVL